MSCFGINCFLGLEFSCEMLILCLLLLNLSLLFFLDFLEVGIFFAEIVNLGLVSGFVFVSGFELFEELLALNLQSHGQIRILSLLDVQVRGLRIILVHFSSHFFFDFVQSGEVFLFLGGKLGLSLLSLFLKSQCKLSFEAF